MPYPDYFFHRSSSLSLPTSFSRRGHRGSGGGRDLPTSPGHAAQNAVFGRHVPLTARGRDCRDRAGGASRERWSGLAFVPLIYPSPRSCRFAFAGTRVGLWTVRATAGGQATQSSSVSVNLPPVVSMRPAQVTGDVVSSQPESSRSGLCRVAVRRPEN